MPDTLLRPAHLWVPEHDRTLGPEVVDLVALTGRELDGEQELIVDTFCAVRPDGKWSTREDGLVASRQNIKTFAFEGLALADLFLFECMLVVWTAHLFDTAQESFRHLSEMVDGCADLSREVKAIHRARGDEGIELMSGARLNFLARSKSGGRGLSGDSVYLDEAFALSATEMGALMPTTSARPNPKIRYGSSAGMLTSAQLRTVRNRGRNGGDPSLAYIEWCAPEGGCASESCDHHFGIEGCALDDPENWRLANPAMDRRIPQEAIAAERRSLPPTEFARERMGWWEDPPEGIGGKLPAGAWENGADPKSQIVTPPAFAVDITPDRSRSSLCVVGGRSDEHLHGEVVLNDAGTGWVVAAVDRATAKAGARKVALDPSSPAGSLIPALEDKGIEVVSVSAREVGQSCGSLVDLLAAGRFHHLDQHELNLAVASASTKDVGDGLWKWSRASSLADITPLYGVTLALHLHATDSAAPPNLW